MTKLGKNHSRSKFARRILKVAFFNEFNYLFFYFHNKIVTKLLRKILMKFELISSEFSEIFPKAPLHPRFKNLFMKISLKKKQVFSCSSWHEDRLIIQNKKKKIVDAWMLNFILDFGVFWCAHRRSVVLGLKI